MSLADDLKNLDPNNPGLWPLPVQLIVGVAVCGILMFAGWYTHLKNQRAELATVTAKEDELKKTFEDKQKKVANLNALKEQMKEMQQSFGDMLRQLPNKTEVAGLIVDISQTGLAAGLEFELFQPQAEQPSEFYAELPINIRVTGNYHQLGEFVSGVAALPRIVTTHNVTMNRRGKGKGAADSDSGLIMSAVAKTYRALDDEGS
ncbi:MAG: type 4a pilus biogenesis protein PilO [Gammaproteobacteria bacterium]|nr:type 4a pilus biogenesis protein PilO [Gammaproteobacteria bacterium]